MLDEYSLHNKINMLQAKMLKFHEEISPVKTREAERNGLPCDDESKFLSLCLYIGFGFLKVIVCIIGPTLFPAIVYCIEGSSILFWQVTLVSCIITLLLALMTVTLLCVNLKMVQGKVKEIFKSLSNVYGNNGPFQMLRETLTSDYLKKNIHKVLYPAVLLLLGSLISYASYTMNIWTGFYISLVLIGFVGGNLMTILCDLLSSPELLPFHSPCKIRMELETPTRQVGRELDFAPPEQQRPAPTSRLLTPNTALIRQSPGLTDTPTTSYLPNYSASINRGEVGNKNSYLLPFDISKFFRRLQS